MKTTQLVDQSVDVHAQDAIFSEDEAPFSFTLEISRGAYHLTDCKD